MTINLADLDEKLKSAGYPILGLGLCGKRHPTASPADFIEGPEGHFVRVDWWPEPSQAVKDRVAAAIASYLVAPPKSREDRLEELRAKRRSGKALSASEQQELLDLLLGV